MNRHSENKICPHCAESIKAATRICPFCQKKPNGRFYLTWSTWLMLFVVVMSLAGFLAFDWLLRSPRDFSKHRNEVSVLTADMAEADVINGKKELIVFGTLTNHGRYEWLVGKFEAQFFDKDQKLADVALGSDYFTLLPGSEHAYRLSIYGRRLDPKYASVKVYPRSIVDPKRKSND